jgi:hypothetical protein
MKVIKIHDCSECPHSEKHFKDKISKETKLSEHLVHVELEHYNEYYCDEMDHKFCGKNMPMPDWCPLEDL